MFHTCSFHCLWRHAALLMAMALLFPLTVRAQNTPVPNTPNMDGLRFLRLGNKSPETLAKKPGGPTERIEIQSTDDHIDYVVKTYVLKYANASEVFEMINQAVEKENGSVYRIAQGSAVETDAEGLECKRTYEGDSMLVVTMPDWMIPFIDQTMETLDRKDLDSAAFGTGAIFANIKHRLPSEVARLIQESTASPSVVLIPDDTHQVLYMEDTPSFFTCDLEALRYFDAPPPQIETRVRIYEISEDNGRDVGPDWYAWKKSIEDGNLAFGWEGRPGSYNLDLQSLSAELSFTPQIATEFLNYLVSRGHAKVMTDSRLTQTNAQPATIKSTTDLPYVIRGYDGDGVADAPLRDSPPAMTPEGVIKEFTEGVIVEMTPRIASEIEMTVKASVASHVGYTPTQNVPLITNSEVNTVALLVPERPAVLGGLCRESKVRQNSGVIGLRSIPGLRALFSHEIERKQRSQIIITIELGRVAAGDSQNLETAVALPPRPGMASTNGNNDDQ
ncbi:MAG: type II and III secretion system protein [bacterium]|nr:type II and III secretion system protein [bacterium]